ncbi:protein PLASTID TRANSCRIPTIONALLY ACTIVE 16, chloroplastic [Impatiens glandulifera]|uniref:protein PLASTID TRANSCRIPTIONALLY ACTIVE 16, chloroplastic n=1 Tax=Impatiens glandulifera TaxID=253017 RepID=UPI001FB16AC3|nr:protein PLASTID TRANSCRIPTIONALLY ACTIVE 16, chloroplastic [Impatiens glandulifera]
MAPTLSSSAFITPQHSLTLRNPRLSIYAATKNGAGGSFPSFRLGKLGVGSSSDEEASQGSDSGNSTTTPFSFNFGKLSSDVKSLVPVLSKPAAGLSFGQSRKKDSGTVFVAGATGQAGIRIAQTLLREGFNVRAGVPDLGSAQELARLAAAYKLISSEESRRLNAVESTFQDAESIAKAIGNASKVVVTIGQAENGPVGEVTTSDALQVIEAAQIAGVTHVAIVYDGSISTASTYNVLDGIQTFFNNFFSRSQPLTINEFLQKLVATDVSYTLMKTSLTDDYSPEGSFNVVVSAERNGAVDSNDYKVSTSKIASLVANVFSNTSVTENKVVEVSSDPSAPSKSADELFSGIPEDGRRKAYLEALEKAKTEELERKSSEEAVKAAKTKEKEVKRIEEEPEEVESNGGVSVESMLDKAKGFGSGLSWEKFSSQLTAAAAAQKQVIEKSKAQIATVRGQAKARNLPSKKAVIKQPPAQKNSVFRPKSEPKEKQSDEKKEVRKVFGGLFKQETIYIDDV